MLHPSVHSNKWWFYDNKSKLLGAKFFFQKPFLFSIVLYRNNINLIIPKGVKFFFELSEGQCSLTNSVQSTFPYLPLHLRRLQAVAPSLGSPIYTSFSTCQSSGPCVHTDCPGALGGQTGPVYPPTSPVGAILEVGLYSQSHSRSTAFPSQGYLKEKNIS